MPSEAPQSNPQFLEMPLYPTIHVDAEGRTIWETTAEIAPILGFALLDGGPWAPSVTPVLEGDSTRPGRLDPEGWN